MIFTISSEVEIHKTFEDFLNSLHIAYVYSRQNLFLYFFTSVPESDLKGIFLGRNGDEKRSETYSGCNSFLVMNFSN
jgi:hypothetical protein